ncbi:tripartite tricarboxylate transporter substrate-binding protein [Cupriavidus basilensis]
MVENRGGGGGVIGADALAKSAPDGYTLGIATVSTMATNPATNARNPYDPIKDFAPITNLVNVPNVLTVNPKVPAKTLKEFVALLKSSPGKYTATRRPARAASRTWMANCSRTSPRPTWSISHTADQAPRLTTALAGQVNVQFDNLPSSMPFIQTGKLRALAVAAPKRVEGLPDVPTFAEAGMKDMNNMAWYGLVAPANTPAAIITRVHDAAVKALQDPAVKRRLADSGAYPDGNTSSQYAAQIKRELDLRKKIAH